MIDALLSQQARLLDADPYAHLYQLLTNDSRHHTRRDRAWEAIAPIVAALDERGAEDFLPHSLSALITAAAQSAHVEIKQIHTWLRYYWQGGQTRNALLPRYARSGGPGQRRVAQPDDPKRGRPRGDAGGGGVNVTEEIGEHLERYLRVCYHKENLTLRDTYERLLREQFSTVTRTAEGFAEYTLAPDYPSWAQFYAYSQRWRKRDPAKSAMERMGERAYLLTERPVLGSLRANVFGPGSMFEIDATPLDVYVVNAINRTWVIGCPNLYLVVDRFSSLITGMALTFEEQSWAGAVLALENMTLDKEALCAEYGVPCPPGAWPARHCPKGLTTDRGELLQEGAAHAIESLDIRFEATPSWRGDRKPYVERRIGGINSYLVCRLPGHVTRARQRGDPDPRLGAALTMQELRRALFSAIIEFNTSHRVDPLTLDEQTRAALLAPTPAELWEWGVGQRGALRTISQDSMRAALLRRREATVQPDGIHYGGLRYQCDRALREGWFLRSSRRQRVTILEDPRTCARIYLAPITPRVDTLEVCTLTPADEQYGAYEWAEVLDQRKRQASAARDRQDQFQTVRLNHGAFQD